MKSLYAKLAPEECHYLLTVRVLDFLTGLCFGAVVRAVFWSLL